MICSTNKRHDKTRRDLHEISLSFLALKMQPVLLFLLLLRSRSFHLVVGSGNELCCRGETVVVDEDNWT
jgi:hypothetical protein